MSHIHDDKRHPAPSKQAMNGNGNGRHKEKIVPGVKVRVTSSPAPPYNSTNQLPLIDAPTNGSITPPYGQAVRPVKARVGGLKADGVSNGHTNGHTNGHGNGHAQNG